MNYLDFAKEYNKKTSAQKDKEALVKKHVVRQYVPYAEKLSEAKSIADISTHATLEETEETFYKKNTPLQYFFTFAKLVQLYTDIEWDDNDIVTMYDTLNENGSFNALLSNIPESEITEFKTLVDMCVSDIYENEHDISSFLDTKLKASSIALNAIMEGLNEAINKIGTPDNVTEFPMNKPEGKEDK